MAVPRRFLTDKNCFLKNIALIYNARNTYSNQPYILKSPFQDVEIPNVTLPEFIFSKASQWPNHVAAECGLTGRKYTYDQVRIQSRNLAGALRKKLKLNKGDVVALLMPNSPEYFITALGIVQAGLVLTTLNPMYTPGELSRQLFDSSTKVVITITDLWNNAKKSTDLVNSSTNNKIHILTFSSTEGQSIPNGAINLKQFLSEKTDFSEKPEGDSSDIAFLPYSSGTTGMPKGVELSHRNIIANLLQINIPELSFCTEATANHQDIVPVILPQFHIYGLTVNTFHTLYKGCKSVCLPKFTPDTFMNLIRNYKASVLFVAPPIITFMSTHDSVKSEDFDWIGSVISGAAPLGARDEQALLKKANKNLVIRQGYGLTETSPAVAILSNTSNLSASGTIGLPVPNTQIKVASLENPEIALEPDSTGELLVKGPQVMRGYHNKPKETYDTFIDGWLRTGDVVYYNKEGYLFVTDRLKELIKVKGFQVPPAELEEIIRSFPNIADAAVIGIPHELDGEVPRAYVVPKNGTTVDTKKLQEYVAENVTNYKRLTGGVSIVESIPKNPSGKILRRMLKVVYENEGR